MSTRGERLDDRPRTAAGDRFQFDGSAGDFVGTAILAGLLTLITFGIGYPWALCRLQGWKASHTTIGGRRLRFDGTGLGLIGNWIKWWFFLVITLGIYTFWLIPAVNRWIIENTAFEDR
jgi:uncharacterized membrane protein YjgN (DUF898 family)